MPEWNDFIAWFRKQYGRMKSWEFERRYEGRTDWNQTPEYQYWVTHIKPETAEAKPRWGILTTPQYMEGLNRWMQSMVEAEAIELEEANTEIEKIYWRVSDLEQQYWQITDPEEVSALVAEGLIKLPHYADVLRGKPYAEVYPAKIAFEKLEVERETAATIRKIYEKDREFYDWLAPQLGVSPEEAAGQVANWGQEEFDQMMQRYQEAQKALIPLDVDKIYEKGKDFYDWLAKEPGMAGLKGGRGVAEYFQGWSPEAKTDAMEKWSIAQEKTGAVTAKQKEDLARWGGVITAEPNLEGYIKAMATQPPEGRAEMEKWLQYRLELPSRQIRLPTTGQKVSVPEGAVYSPYLREVITKERAATEPYLLKTTEEAFPRGITGQPLRKGPQLGQERAALIREKEAEEERRQREWERLREESRRAGRITRI